MLGLFFEPYEGGIKKDRATMSYYFVTAGCAICLLIGFSILIDVFRRKRWVQLLIENGQNPMIAYAGINNLVIPVLALTTAEQIAFLAGLLALARVCARGHHHAAAGAERELLHEAEDLLADVAGKQARAAKKADSYESALVKGCSPLTCGVSAKRRGIRSQAQPRQMSPARGR